MSKHIRLEMARTDLDGPNRSRSRIGSSRSRTARIVRDQSEISKRPEWTSSCITTCQSEIPSDQFETTRTVRDLELAVRDFEPPGLFAICSRSRTAQIGSPLVLQKASLKSLQLNSRRPELFEISNWQFEISARPNCSRSVQDLEPPRLDCLCIT